MILKIVIKEFLFHFDLYIFNHPPTWFFLHLHGMCLIETKSFLSLNVNYCFVYDDSSVIWLILLLCNSSLILNVGAVSVDFAHPVLDHVGPGEFCSMYHRYVGRLIGYCKLLLLSWMTENCESWLCGLKINKGNVGIADINFMGLMTFSCVVWNIWLMPVYLHQVLCIFWN